MSRPRVLLLHQRISLPWVFDSARRAGIDLLLVPRADEPLDGAVLPPAVVEVLAADPAGVAACVRAAHRRAPFDGILTLYDPAVPLAAGLARELGLPALSAATAEAVRDKRLMRRLLAAAGQNVPGFAALSGPEEWPAAAGLRFPVVVKPAGGYSSLGVTRVDRVADLAAVTRRVAAVAAAAGDPGGGLVVEEYVDGPEYAVESLAYRGEVRVLTIGYKGNPVGPHFEESAYLAPARLPPATTEAITAAVTGAHAALGVTDGPAHTELRLRGGTEPYVLELGARVGGSGVSHYVVEGVTGIDLAAEALRIAAGLPPESFGRPVRAQGVAANYIVPCGGAGRITAITGLAEAAADPRVGHVVQMLFPGDVVRPYPDFSGYPAFVLSRHPSYADAERMHDRLARTVRISYGPVGDTG